MKKKKHKRTAGQRRYLTLKKKIDDVRNDLNYFRNEVVRLDAEGKQWRAAYIAQKLTEAVERLKNDI